MIRIRFQGTFSIPAHASSGIPLAAAGKLPGWRLCFNPATDPDCFACEPRQFAGLQDGAWTEVVDLLAGHPGAPPDSAEPLMLYAEACIRSGAPQRARERLQAILPLLERTPHRGPYRTPLNLLGAASFAVGALDEAQAAWDRALELALEADDTLLVARATKNLGAIANLRGAVAMTYRDMGELTSADESSTGRWNSPVPRVSRASP